MPEYIIAGIPVHFPFEPYDVQKAYMEKVITCLNDGTNAVLESPTGTGKTLSLLCSTLAWILSRKADMQSLIQKNAMGGAAAQQAANELNAMQARNASWGIPKIIYASRTHSQLTQAMQELKRTSYSFMRAVVLGSRDQLCIHPEVMREQGNSNKVQLCKLRITTRTCTFYNRVESKKDCAELKEFPVMDIEDLVRVGRKVKVCPYYASKELTSDADITFMPYNYLLDPKARKANKVELSNTIVILDEAHNIEKICEESASVQIRSSDIALAIDDVTHVMKAMMNENVLDLMSGDEPKDFKLEDLALLKEMLLELEKGIDDIVVEDKAEGATFPPSFLFELLAAAKITPPIAAATINLLEKLITFLAVQSQDKAFRKGGSFDTLANLLNVVFIKKDDVIAKIHKSFKVHVQIEEIKQQNKNKDKDGWLSKAPSNNSKLPKIINYWCFNPGFGMEQLLNSQVRSIILTSGTLAPLKPLIAELAVPIAQSLENPHIVSQSQVFVKIIGTGPDREQLISNFANRDNPKYLSSLGQTVLNVSRIVPDGLLVFFPSYPLLNQCVNTWQASGLWAEVCRHKPVFVEPRGKESFTTTMEEFYKSISDGKGACFLAVCRGKVSEGLDFADRNGRAVIITGLPFPPLKDPKVILKKRYLEDNRTKENELLSGQAWYSLEATRAVNQAIGRVIRHRHDYGAILLCDARFSQSNQASQLSKWVREYLGAYPKSVTFGSIVRELREFFRNADNTLPKPKERSIEALVSETCEEAGIVSSSRYFSDPKLALEAKNKFASAQSMAIKIEKTNSIEGWTPDDYKTAAGRSQSSHVPSAMDFMSRLDNNVKAIDFNSASCSGTSCSSQVSIYKRERMSPTTSPNCSNTNFSAISNKKKRYKLVTDTSSQNLPSPISAECTLNDFSFKTKAKLSISTPVAVEKEAPQERVEFLKILRNSLSSDDFSDFTAALMAYSRQDKFEEFMKVLLRTMSKPELHYMLRGMRRFIKSAHKELFDEATVHIFS